MFYKSPIPRGLLIRLVVVLMVFTTVFGGSFSSLPIGKTRVSAALPFAPPANDNFANAEPILGVSGVVFGTTVGATKEPHEEEIEGISGSGSVWYKWQAPTNGRYVFTTYQSNFNTMLAVYSGETIQGIQVVANDNDPTSCFDGMRSSKVAFNATAGLTYYIAVDGKFDSGNVTLRWGRSATIDVRPRTISSTNSSGALGAKLDGDLCGGSNFASIFTFFDVPTGGQYTISIVKQPGDDFSPAKDNPSISPLTGNVTLIYYLVQPAYTISGRVPNLPEEDRQGLTVNCASINGALRSQPATTTIIAPFVEFECRGLPANADYIVTPSRLGYRFDPTDKTKALFGDTDFGSFNAIAELPRTISGRVTLPNGTTGLSGATVALSGSQTDSKPTDSNGNYSFTVPYGGNYSVTPTHSNFTFTPSSRSFSNVTTNQPGDFTAAFVLQLILDEDGQVAALDSVLHTRDPFSVMDITNLLNPGNTRVAVFVSGFQLGPGELASSVEINLVGSNAQTYNIPAEDVRLTSNPAFTQVIFKLPDTLATGICTLFVKAHGLTSNLGSMKIKS